MRTQIAVTAIRYGIFLFLLGGLSTQSAIAAPIGAQLIVQVWDPRNPDAQEYQTPYDSNSALSDAVSQVWQETRNFVCGPLAKRMGTGDLLAKGVTLYDIKCRIPDGEVIATQNGGRGLTLAYRVKGVSFAATSTTPTMFGSYADPGLSITFDLDFAVTLAMQLQGDLVRVSTANVKISNTQIDSRTASADIAKWIDDTLVPLFKGQSFRSQAEAALNKLNPDFANRVNAQLAPVNAALRGPQNLIRVGVWARPNKIYVALAPAEWVPPENSQVSGQITWKNTAVNGSVASCAAFPMSGIVQTGPALLSDPVSRSTNPAPTRTFGHIVSATPVIPMGDTLQCRYTLGPLPAGIPLTISASVPIELKPRYGSNTFFKGATTMSPVGWNRRTVPDGGAGRDWVLASGIRANPVATVPDVRQKLIDPGPVVDPAASFNSRVKTLDALQPAVAGRLIQPQALQPKAGTMLSPAATHVGQPVAATQGLSKQSATAVDKARPKALQLPAAADSISGNHTTTVQEQMSRRSSLRSPAAAISNGSVPTQQIGQ